MFWNLPLDNNGWLVPILGSKPVYVSSTTGNDNQPGTIDKPIRTIGRAMGMRGTSINLKRGDRWPERLVVAYNGSPTAPLWIGAYGSGNRPIVQQVMVQNKTGVVITEIATSTPADACWIYGASYWWIEGCSFSNAHNGMTIQCFESMMKYGVIRRNLICFNRPQQKGANGKFLNSEGMYVANVDYLWIAENLVHANGKPPATMFNQNVYCQAENGDNVCIEGNFIGEAGLSGLQARAGGVVQKNLLLNNPQGLNWGAVSGAGPQHPGGAKGKVYRNVIIGTQQDYPMQLGANTTTVDVAENLLLDNVGSPIHFTVGHGDHEKDQVGFNNMSVHGNIAYPYNGKGITTDTNRPYRQVFLAGNANMPLTGTGPIQQSHDFKNAYQFPEPNRRVSGTWLHNVMGPPDIFTRATWDASKRPEAVVDWILAGFGIGGSALPPVTPNVEDSPIKLNLWRPQGATPLVDGDVLDWTPGWNIEAVGGQPPYTFFLDEKQLGAESNAPYFMWGDDGPGKPRPGPELPPGPHTIRVETPTGKTKLVIVVRSDDPTVADLLNQISTLSPDPLVDDRVNQILSLLSKA